MSILGVLHSSVPNFLFMNELRGQYDEILFITTPEVDEAFRGEELEEALGIDPGVACYVSINGNDYQAALATLSGEAVGRQGDKYIVNLTGGTKMMSLAVHDYFARFDSTFYYVPIGKNKYYNLSSGEWLPLLYRASLKEYFKLYGISFESVDEKDFKHSEREAMDIFNAVKRRCFYLTPLLLDAQNARTSELRRYYGGEWFEQFCYFKLKETYNLSDDDIAMSLKIFRTKGETTNDNELDVAFMYENKLNVIECKVSMHGWGREPKDVVEDYLYKLAAVSKDFGLQVDSYLFTLHKMQKFSPSVRKNFEKRCRILNIKGIVSGYMFSDLSGELSKLQNHQS